TVYTLVNWRDGSLLQFFNRMGFERGDMINLEHKINMGESGFCYPSPNKFSYNNRAVKEFKDSLSEFPLIIRMMRAEDLERIIEIDHQLLGEKRPDFWKRKLDMIEKNSVLPPLVAETGNKVIGFILGQASSWEYIVPENIGWIDTLGVDLAYQRKGVARSLMGELLNRMKKFGVNTVYTLVNWRDGSLLQFFNRMGFERGGIINLELKIDIEKSDFATIQRSYNNRESLRKEK
ncbi:MAG: GNAT family N-acetyltransferase, partial [Promethearchaeota archaeon]